MSILESFKSWFGLEGDEFDDYEEYEEPVAPRVQPQQPQVDKSHPARVQQTATRTPQPRRAVQPQNYQSAPQVSPRVQNNQYASFDRPNPQPTPVSRVAKKEEKVLPMDKSNQKITQIHNGSVRIAIKEPRVYSESKDIATLVVQDGEAVLLNFHLMEESSAGRMLDFLTGVVYAVRGDIQRVGNEIFLCTPPNVQIDGATTRSLLADQDFDL